MAKVLLNEMFCRFSLHEQLRSDQGRQFKADLMKEIYALLQIHKTHTTAYHSHCNGLIERFNRTLLDVLCTVVKDHQSIWRVCLAYNSSVHASTRVHPLFT